MWKKIKKSFLESNRYKHFGYSIMLGFLFTIISPVSANAGMEFKDKAYGNKFDWLDLLWGCLGGLVGQLLQLIVIYLIWF